MSPVVDNPKGGGSDDWLHDTDAPFRMLVDSVQDYAIFLLDQQGLIRSWNAGAERIKGYKAQEIIGRHFSVFYPPDDAADVTKRILAMALRDGRFEDYGWRVRKDGSRFWASVMISTLRNPAGKHVGFAKVTRDLTDRAYRSFVEATNAIVWNTDGDGRPNVDSPSWRAFTGQTEEEWRGLKGWDPVHPDDQVALRVKWPKAKAAREVFESEFRLRRHDGAYIWMAARAVPFLKPDGAVREWFGVTFDISSRKRAEEERNEALAHEHRARLEAERAESRWTTTLRSIGDAVIVTDLERRITFMNPVAETLTGWHGGDAIGRALSDVFSVAHEDTRGPADNPVDRVLREGVVVGLAKHMVLLRQDGRAVPIDDSAAPIRDQAGNLIGAVMVFRDVTNERREAQERGRLLEREREAREQAEHASRTKDEFLATVSHELRNPLNAILGWAKLLLLKELPADFRKPLATIERNARAQARLIDDVLDVSRIISGKLHLDLGAASVAQAVTDALEASRPLAEKKGVSLVARVAPGASIHADQIRLQQIVSNLVSNAVKFTPGGGRVTVEADLVGPRLRIAVHDSGEGIDPSLLSAIFEPFRQADASTTRRHGGLGLGLAIVRQLAHAHGGTVRAQSGGKGRGATFIVDLPAGPGDVRLTLSSRSSLAELPRLSGTRVLVVDDEPDAVDLLRELLETAGGTVETAGSAEEALAKLPGFRPQVLVSDIGMPDIDGHGLLRRLRALPPSSGGQTPAVALTAYSRLEDAQSAFNAGFQSHLGKPVDPTQLLIVVANLAGLPLHDDARPDQPGGAR